MVSQRNRWKQNIAWRPRTKVFFDFGMSFSAKKQFYSPTGSSRYWRNQHDWGNCKQRGWSLSEARQDNWASWRNHVGWVGYSDVDRFNTFFSVAKKNNRCLAVSLKQEYLLEALRNNKHLKVPALSDDSLLIFRKSKERYDKWESQLIERYEGEGKIFDVFEVSKKQLNIFSSIFLILF